MLNIAKGIITKGLGGNATSMIVGVFGLGPASVTVEIIPPSTGFAGGIYIPKPGENLQTIKFTVRYKEEIWTRTYRVSRLRSHIIINITKFMSMVTKGVSVAVTKLKKIINTIRIK